MVRDDVFVMIPNPHHGEEISVKLQLIILKEAELVEMNGFQCRDSISSKVESFSPKTSRGRRLLALRQKIISAGIPLLTPEEIEEKVRVGEGEEE